MKARRMFDVLVLGGTALAVTTNGCGSSETPPDAGGSPDGSACSCTQEATPGWWDCAGVSCGGSVCCWLCSDPHPAECCGH